MADTVPYCRTRHALCIWCSCIRGLTIRCCLCSAAGIAGCWADQTLLHMLHDVVAPPNANLQLVQWSRQPELLQARLHGNAELRWLLRMVVLPLVVEAAEQNRTCRLLSQAFETLQRFQQVSTLSKLPRPCPGAGPSPCAATAAVSTPRPIRGIPGPGSAGDPGGVRSGGLQRAGGLRGAGCAELYAVARCAGACCNLNLHCAAAVPSRPLLCL